MAVRLQFPALLACTLALAACAGGRGSTGFAPPSLPQDARSEAAAGDVAMTYSIMIPAPKPALEPAARHAQFVSASTQSIVFQAYKAGKPHTPGNLISMTVVALNAGAKGCTGAKARTCKGTLELPPPSVDIVATTYDLKPAGKKIPPKAKKLAIDTIGGVLVKAGKKIGITLDGIPVSFTMTIPGAVLVAGVPTLSVYGSGSSNSPIRVQALDADGNVILTDGFVNAAGKSTGIAMTVTPLHATCTTPVLAGGTATPAASITVSMPPKDGSVLFEYGTAGIAAPFQSPGYCSFSLTAKLGSGATQTGAFVLTGPQLNEYSVGPSNSNPQAIVVGPDNNLWFTDANGSVGTIDASSKAIVEYSVGPVHGIVSYLGSLWVSADSSFLQMNTSGTVVNTYANTTAPGQQLAVSPDGNFWFSEIEAQKIAYVTPLGAATEIPIANKVYPEGIATGPDGNMWFTGCIGQVIERISPAAANLKVFAVPNGPSGQPYPTFITTASDGNFWFTSCPGGSISRMPVPAGSTVSPTLFKAPTHSPQGRGQIWGLAPGPNADMWFADLGSKTVDRIPLAATSAGQIATIPVSASPQWVVTGPDGAIWFTEWTLGNSTLPNGKIGRIVP